MSIRRLPVFGWLMVYSRGVRALMSPPGVLKLGFWRTRATSRRHVGATMHSKCVGQAFSRGIGNALGMVINSPSLA